MVLKLFCRVWWEWNQQLSPADAVVWARLWGRRVLPGSERLFCLNQLQNSSPTVRTKTTRRSRTVRHSGGGFSGLLSEWSHRSWVRTRTDRSKTRPVLDSSGFSAAAQTADSEAAFGFVCLLSDRFWVSWNSDCRGVERDRQHLNVKCGALVTRGSCFCHTLHHANTACRTWEPFICKHAEGGADNRSPVTPQPKSRIRTSLCADVCCCLSSPWLLLFFFYSLFTAESTCSRFLSLTAARPWARRASLTVMATKVRRERLLLECFHPPEPRFS